MWAGINGNRNLPDEPRCPKCNHIVAVHYAEREYEANNAVTEDLETCSAIEAWINCPHHGWLTERSNDQMWSDEVFGDDDITNEHIDQAVDGTIEYWREHNQPLE